MAARPKGLTEVSSGVALLGAVLAAAAAGVYTYAAGERESGQRRDSAQTAATEAPARRIVSVVPAVTEMLFAMGAGPQVVAVSSYDEYPPEVRSLPRVGALLDPDTERILSLRPDLVVAYGSQTDLLAQLDRTGIRAYDYRHGALTHIVATIRDLGPIVGRVRESDRLAAGLQAQLDAVASRVRGRARPRTVLVFGRDVGALRGLYVSGGRGFLHEMLEIAGGVNVFADVDRESVQPSLETLLARAPEVVIEVRATDMLPATLARERDVWDGLSSLPAVRNDRVYFLHGDPLVVPGPRVGEGTEDLARALHPGAFE